MPKMTTRTMTTNDLNDVRDLLDKGLGELWEGREEGLRDIVGYFRDLTTGKIPFAAAQVGEIEGEVIGVAGYRRFMSDSAARQISVLDYLTVREDWRGCGAATNMVKWSADHAFNHGYSFMTARIGVEAIGFYERIGWTVLPSKTGLAWVDDHEGDFRWLGQPADRYDRIAFLQLRPTDFPAWTFRMDTSQPAEKQNVVHAFGEVMSEHPGAEMCLNPFARAAIGTAWLFNAFGLELPMTRGV